MCFDHCLPFHEDAAGRRRRLESILTRCADTTKKLKDLGVLLSWNRATVLGRSFPQGGRSSVRLPSLTSGLKSDCEWPRFCAYSMTICASFLGSRTVGQVDMVLDDLGRDFLRKHQIKHVDHQRARLRFLIRFVRQAHRRPEIPVHSERKLVLLIPRVQKLLLPSEG